MQLSYESHREPQRMRACMEKKPCKNPKNTVAHLHDHEQVPRRVQACGTEADNIGMVRAALQQVDLPPEVGLQMRIARVTISDLGRSLSPLRIMVAQAAYTA